FHGEGVADLARSTASGEVPPPPPSARVPNWVRRIALRGLSPRPSERYPSMDALLADLRRDRGARRRKLLPAGAALAATVVLAALHAARARSQLCAGAERKLEGIWDPPRQALVQAALLGSAKPYGTSAWAAVHQSLDAYVAAWVSMHREACEATRL